jgi:oligopeptide/dipeptide ABC transporter ATP-binding protein
VLGAPRHPYTQGLLRSMPARVLPGERLVEIPGVVPAPDLWPAGCRFADRCALVMEVCRLREPERTLFGANAAACCHAVAAEASR